MSDVARVLPWSQGESELVTELQSGSGPAFDWLITHYSGPVYSLVAGMVSEPSDAADITQDVFLKAFRGIRGFRRGSSLKTWLYRIAVREALNHRRWLWRHHRQQDSIDVEESDGRAAIEIQDSCQTPFDQAACREVQDAVQNALQGVPAIFRSAVILRDLEGMSYEEVAEVLGVSCGTVKSRILRGRRMLREILKPLLDHTHPIRSANPMHEVYETADTLVPVLQAGDRAHLAPGHQTESMLHSTMFRAKAKPERGASSDDVAWAKPIKTGAAEGGAW